MRNLFKTEPYTDLSTLDELLGVALAMEEEAVRRYRQLAGIMERRGAFDTAATFRDLAGLEEGHVRSIVGLAGRLPGGVPDSAGFVWHLPGEMAASWDDLTDRTQVTPYQALALAVLNEQRGFAFYSYIASNADDPGLRAQAEGLALEELGHASQLRVERRRAFHRRRHAPVVEVESLAELTALAAPRLAAASAAHRAMAKALSAAGDVAGAALLAGIAEEEGGSGAGTVAPAIPAAPADILRAALTPCAELAEWLADVAAAAKDEDVLLESQRLQERSVRHMAAIAGHSRNAAE